MNAHSSLPSNWLSVFFALLLLVLLSAPAAFEQRSSPPNPQTPQSPSSVNPSGMSTGGAHAPVKDAKSRPITAGGFVDGAPIVFLDITKQSGLAKFHDRSGSPEKSTILDAPGSGVALLDYDNDGWLDIYLLNGSTAAAVKGKEAPPRAMLLRNNHDGTFTDVAEKAGVILAGWSTGSTWGDYDHDGLLDLFVPGYVKHDLDRPVFAGKNGVPEGACQYRGVNVFCGPVGLLGESDHLFHNNGDGTFTDVSVKAGVADREGRYGFASVFVDLDDDGWLDLFITTFSDDYKTLYRNEGDANFTDVSFRAGLGNPTIPFLAWGCGFLDFDNDGFLDIFIANGNVYPVADRAEWGTTWAERPQLFRNLDGSKFQEVPSA